MMSLRLQEKGNDLVKCTLSFPPADPEAVEIDPGAETELPLNSGLTRTLRSDPRPHHAV